jgi:hypothetical protein
MPFRFIVILLLVCSAAVSGADKGAITADALMKHIKFLSSDELEGRGNGSKGLERAADYIASQLKASGVQPGGKDGTWFQPFELVTG